MKRPRSIRVQLITLYVCLLSLVFLCFGAYTYWGLRQFLVRSLQQALLRRADQIAVTILDELPTRGESYVASEIQARYAPELNERAIRIVDVNHREIYLSKNAHFLAADSFRLPANNKDLGKPLYREDSLGDGQKFEIVSLLHTLSNGDTYIVEVGAPETSISSSLNELIVTLAIGFPVLIGLAILWGYSLLGRALRPVDEIVSAAEQITFKNRNHRLPVPETGDEFERISEALNRMIERLDESFQIANRFSADASHELRTPLTIIQGELEFFVNDPALPPETIERAGDILEEVVRLSRIVEGLLLVSRLEGGEAQINRGSIDLAAMVVSVAEQMELLSKHKLLSLKYDVHPRVFVEGDELRLRQVVVNLIDNAIKYTPEGGSITLKVRSERNNAIIEVIDTGMGISSAALPKIFNRFFRAEEATFGRMKGSGLGLAIVRSIVEAHGGRVYVESNENQGSRFRIELPLIQHETLKQRGGVKPAV